MNQESRFRLSFQTDNGTPKLAGELAFQFVDYGLVFHDTIERILTSDNQVEYELFRLYVMESEYSSKQKVMAFGYCEEEGKCYLGEFPVLSEIENQNRLNQVIAISNYINEEYITPFVRLNLEPSDFKTKFIFKGDQNFSKLKESWENLLVPDMISLLLEGGGSQCFDNLSCYENLIETVQRDKSVDAVAMRSLENILRGVDMLKTKCLELEYGN